MKNKIITAFFLFNIITLQGCATQIIGAAASATVAVASVPVKVGAAAASAATHAVIDRVVGK